MSTTERDREAPTGDEAAASQGSAESSTRTSGPGERESRSRTSSTPTASSMREGAKARVAPRGDISARRTGAARSAGMAGASAAGASAGRSGSRPAGSGAGPRAGATSRRPGPRRVRLTVQRLDPWSVFKISLLLAVAFGISTVIMVGVLWTVLSGMNVFATVNEFIVQVTSGEDTASSFDLMDYIGLRRVLALSTVFAVINVVLLTALATLSAFLYNVCAALVGGTHLTLSDE